MRDTPAFCHHINRTMKALTLLAAQVASSFALPTSTAAPMPTARPQATLIQRDYSTLSASPTNIYSISTQYITIEGQTNSYVTIPAKTVELSIPTCVQTITPDANGHVPPGTCGAIWNYYPSFGAAMLFAGLFGALTVAHVWQAFRFRKVSAILPTWEPSKG